MLLLSRYFTQASSTPIPTPAMVGKAPGLRVGVAHTAGRGTDQCAMCLVLVRKGQDGKAQLVLLDHGLYQFLDEK